MPKLPVVSGREVVKALSKKEFHVYHQRGSHITLRRDGPPPNRVTVPNHKELKPGMLRAIIRATGLTVEEFCELL